MLTIFGKKKKDDSSIQIDTGADPSQAPSQTPSIPPESVQPRAPVQTTTQNQPTTWPAQSPVMGQLIPPPPAPSPRQMTPGPTPRQLPLDASFPSEETSLSRILQSLLQEIPAAAGSTFSPMRESTPEYVPLRATPPSKAMVIGQKEDEQGAKLQQEKVPLLHLYQFLSLQLHRFNRNRTSLLRSLRISLRKRTSPQRKLRLRRRKSLRRVSITFSN